MSVTSDLRLFCQAVVESVAGTLARLHSGRWEGSRVLRHVDRRKTSVFNVYAESTETKTSDSTA